MRHEVSSGEETRPVAERPNERARAPAPGAAPRAGLAQRLRRWALKRVALPLLNRELAEQNLHLYRYVPATDRLFPYRRLTARDLDPERAGEILSDRWYRALVDRGVRGDIAFDVGVNYGYSSAWLSTMAGHVYAFEPNPANAAMIREHASIRRIQNVTLVPTAVSNRVGRASLHVKRFDGHHSLADIGASPTVSAVDVPVTTIDTAADERGLDAVDLVKIDVEGFEPEVLEGASRRLERGRVGLVLFEFSPGFYRQRGLPSRAPIDVLEGFGYAVEQIDGSPVPGGSLDDVWQMDLIARRRTG